MNNPSHDRPGVREQHLLRKKNNPLFDERQRDVSNEELASARLADGVEMDRFRVEFQALVQQAVDLKPNTPSDTVLEIKEALDRGYQQACALPGDQQQVKQAIRKLVALIMQAIRAGAGNDAYAIRQLEEEEIARTTHFELQELPLVAALTHPASPIVADELVPSLLSEPEATLARSLHLFDANQMAILYRDARSLLQEKDPAQALVEAWQRLKVIEDHYLSLPSDSAAKPEVAGNG